MINTSSDVNLVTNFNSLPENFKVVEPDGTTKLLNKSNIYNYIKQMDLDLYLVNAEVSPPIYKLIDYNKFKYRQHQKDKDNIKKSKANNKPIKEYYFKPMIEDHDIQVKISQIKNHLNEGYDVRIAMDLKRSVIMTLTVRGSRPLYEVVHNDNFVLNKVLNGLSDLIQPTKLNLSDNSVSSMLRKIKI